MVCSLLEKPKDSVLLLMKKTPHLMGDKVDYWVYDASPACGILYIINDFLSGHVRLLGRGGGRYPYNYLDMIDAVFGKAKHTIEVCSGDMESNNNLTTVDITNEKADAIMDAQDLSHLKINAWDRWRADPPYNEKTAKEMYNCKMPNLNKLLAAGVRVIKPGSLMFLLCNQNYQHHPKGTKRIGLILITVVPNNEIRACNIYRKLSS